MQAYLRALESALVVSRHLKARNPSAESLRQDCIRCVQDFNDLHSVLGLEAPVFQKLLCLLHFWIDVTLYGDATGFSTFFFESLQSFFARAAFKVSNGQRRQEVAMLRQQTAVAMLRIGPSPAVHRSCGGDPSPPFPSAELDVPTLAPGALPGLVSQQRSHPHGAEDRHVTLRPGTDGFATLLSMLPLEAQLYLDERRGATQDAERAQRCIERIFEAVGVTEDRLRRRDVSFAFVAVYDSYTFDVEGASRLDWPGASADATARRARRVYDIGDPKATQRVRFTLHNVRPRVSQRMMLLLSSWLLARRDGRADVSSLVLVLVPCGAEAVRKRVDREPDVSIKVLYSATCRGEGWL